MLQIRDLLEKFKSLRDPLEVKEKVCTTINKELKIDLLEPGMIEIKRNIVWIKANPAILQKIYMQKSLCLEVLKGVLPDEHIVDIR